ncbi:MAG: peptidoglycan DD-metalloendopeptidase family protein [Clostridia bacterium]|nr:peptidoglycan DD-metalloendopeptidase family protein [Clostridia bacterium]
MGEKQTVVIQGRTIERERPSERARYSYQSRYSYPSRAEVSDESRNIENRSLPSTYSLSTLRESRYLTLGSKGFQGSPKLEPRARKSSSRYSTERTSSGYTPAGGPRPRQRLTAEPPQHNSLMIKIGVSVVLILIIFLLNSIPLPFIQGVVDQVRTALTWEFDFDEALGKLKFVSDALPDQIKSVFRQGGEGFQQNKQDESAPADFASPVRGEVIRSFGEQVVLPDTGKVYANQGIDIKTAENAVVYASADGYVAAIEDHDIFGVSIWVDHGNKVFTFYGRTSQVNVNLGQRVSRGQELGKLGVKESSSKGEPTLHFQIWIDDKPVNPLEHITRTSQVSERQSV